jgi:hypothetical protein
MSFNSEVPAAIPTAHLLTTSYQQPGEELASFLQLPPHGMHGGVSYSYSVDLMF